MKKFKACTKDPNKMNDINKKRHLETCVTCREKDKSKGIAFFFKKRPQVQTEEHSLLELEEQTSASSATRAEGQNSDEILEPEVVEAGEQNIAQILEPAINAVESQSEQRLDTLNLKCEGIYIYIDCSHSL